MLGTGDEREEPHIEVIEWAKLGPLSLAQFNNVRVDKE